MAGRRSSPSGGAQLRRLAKPPPVRVAAVAVIALGLHAGGLRSAAPASPPANSSASSSIETVTVEAQRRRKQLEPLVHHFVDSVVVHHFEDSFMRWDKPICPLVAGLPREEGEFILGRITAIASAAHAPLAGENCRRANLFVIVTRAPDALLKKLWHRDTRLFDTRAGAGNVDRFLHSRYAIRVWYDTRGDMGHLETIYAGLGGSGLRLTVPTIHCSGCASRLYYPSVQDLGYVMIVVDVNLVKDLQFGQIADYVAMVGLAQVNLNADMGPVPSILRLFQKTADPPQGVSAWDQALLFSLYNTNQSSVLQGSSMETVILNRLAP